MTDKHEQFVQIKQYETWIRQDQESIARHKNFEKDNDSKGKYARDQITVLTQRINKSNEEITKIKNGQVQQPIIKPADKNLVKIVNKPIQAKPEIYDRIEPVSDNSMNSSYNWYQKTAARIPESYLRKLEAMPSNEGIIWNGIWFFGNQPPTSYDTIVTQLADDQIETLRYVKTWRAGINKYSKVERLGNLSTPIAIHRSSKPLFKKIQA